MTTIVVTGAAALLVLAVLLLALAALHRWERGRRQRRERMALRRARSLLVAVAASDGGEPGDSAIDDLMDVGSELLEEAAVEVLGKLRGAAHARLVILLRRRGIHAAARQNLVSPKPDVRARGARFLGAVGDRDSVEDVAWLLDDPVPEVAQIAARTLGKQGDPWAVPWLLGALDRPDALSVGLVSMSLLQIGRAAITPLVAGLASAKPQGRAAAAEVLGRLGAVEATDPLIRALLYDPAREVRLRSMHALGWIGSPRAAPAVGEVVAMSQDSVARAIGAWTLGEVGDVTNVRLLVEMLDDPHHTVVANAAAALAALGVEGRAALRRVVESDGPKAAYALEALEVQRLRSDLAEEDVPT